LDAVAAGAGQVTVLLGMGDGHFVSGASYSIDASRPGYASPTATGLALADVNGDGKLDLLVANSNIDTVSVWWGTGDGQFSGEIDYPTGATPFGLALGDLDNDGQPDLVTVNLNAKSVSVLLNEGAGTFGQKVDYPVENAGSVAIADLDGDGKLDVVTSNFYSASVLLGLGDGRLAAKVDYQTGQSNSLALGDVNADGKLDIVLANVFSGAGVLAGNGDGTFAAQVDFAAGHYPAGVILADVTADGLPDILLPGEYSDTITVLPSAAGGIVADLKLDYATGGGPNVNWLAAGDLNRDGRVDLVFPVAGNAVAVFLNSTCP
jgi:large repetitive protein